MAIEYLVPIANATNTTLPILATNDYTLIDESVIAANGSVNTTITSTGVDGSDAIWALTDLPETPTSINSWPRQSCVQKL
jgi:hypothetical protein